MTLKELILEMASSKKKLQTSDIQKRSNEFTRQYIVQNLKDLTENGTLVRFGAGAGTFYTLPKNVMSLNNKLRKRLKNKDLKEHEIYFDFEKKLHLKETLDENVYSIFTYSFSEMLNNAIEHSESEEIEVTYYDSKKDLSFEIRDFGIGAFKNVMNKHNLRSEIEAIQDILKGKTTTNPVAHSGQGIFFTSKIADLFIIESYGYRLRIDNTIPDTFIEEISPVIKGTKVIFTINADSEKHLSDVFSSYQTDPDGYDFDKTQILVKLYTMGTVYVSRSQARRILVGLEKYKHIVLDFQNVPTIGQAFADEIFRVFKSRHPDIEIEPINMTETVEFMVKRVD
ncbi:STAS-like domain-containing protein [Candidatus Pacearchaeota archaeon]|nr:STAS-like domain-containing protein [Candidatus Pacearchaeota archaeon]